MRIVASSHGQEWVDRQNELMESLARLGTWVALLESFAYQLVRAGRDVNTSEWLRPPAQRAFAMCTEWVELQVSSHSSCGSALDVVRQEPAAGRDDGQALVARVERTVGLLHIYDLALGASHYDLRRDFEQLWRSHLDPWLAAERTDGDR